MHYRLVGNQLIKTIKNIPLAGDPGSRAVWQKWDPKYPVQQTTPSREDAIRHVRQVAQDLKPYGIDYHSALEAGEGQQGSWSPLTHMEHANHVKEIVEKAANRLGIQHFGMTGMKPIQIRAGYSVPKGSVGNVHGEFEPGGEDSLKPRLSVYSGTEHVPSLRHLHQSMRDAEARQSAAQKLSHPRGFIAVPDATFAHELGHALHARHLYRQALRQQTKDPQQLYQGVHGQWVKQTSYGSKWDGAKDRDTTKQMTSEYGGSTPAEAVAEVFAKWIHGHKVSPQEWDVYHRNGGYPLSYRGHDQPSRPVYTGENKLIGTWEEGNRRYVPSKEWQYAPD